MLPRVERGAPAGGGARLLAIPVGAVQLEGELLLPSSAASLVIFAHGGGSSRNSPRNQFVARTLQRVGLATLLFDSLTADERRQDAQDELLRCDVGLQARRLVHVTDWILHQPFAEALSIGYFGGSTGAAAAIAAATARPEDVQAVVSRGGRPDLAGAALGQLRAPLLLIVGSEDVATLELNRTALGQLPASAALEIVSGAGPFFEEPGALEAVAALASAWFGVHLGRRAGAARRPGPSRAPGANR